MHKVVMTGEGPARFRLPGGHSEAFVVFFGGQEVKVTNHKGDLTIEALAFDAGGDFAVTVRQDHNITVEELKP